MSEIVVDNHTNERYNILVPWTRADKYIGVLHDIGCDYHFLRREPTMKIENNVKLSAYDKNYGFKKVVVLVEKDKRLKLVDEKEITSRHQQS